jgi:hypothetical protein
MWKLLFREAKLLAVGHTSFYGGAEILIEIV